MTVAKRKSKNDAIVVHLFKHGLIWWLLIGWWWRPCVYTYWLFFNIIFNAKIKFIKHR